ncbi:MAG: hypothetical protein RR572_05610 [Raoultibacter sp.]
MSYLIISTVSRSDVQVKLALDELGTTLDDVRVIYADEMNLAACVGCNSCWLRTPGICPIKDDYEQLLIQYLQFDSIIFITEAKFGFVSYKMKNMMDRTLPLLTMYLKCYDGQMRHVARYKKSFHMGILYIGDGDKEYLNEWMARAMLNLHGASLGAYELSQRKELYHALGHN